MPAEIAACVERANLDPEVHVIALAGNGTGFCGGYDLVASAEGDMSDLGGAGAPPGSPLDPAVIGANHMPESNWDPVTDFQFMWRNVRGFMSLFHSEKPVALQGPRLLRRRRHRHGALLRPAGDRRRRQDRLPAGARLGLADDGALDGADRRDAGQAAAADRRLADRRAGGRVGTGDRGRPAGRARRALRGPARAGRADADQPAGDDEDAGQPVALRAGPAPDPAARHLLRRRRPPHRGGARLRPQGGRGRLPGGGARARRALRRPRAAAVSASNRVRPR